MHRPTFLTVAALSTAVVSQQPVPPSHGVPLPPISCLDQQTDRVRPPRPARSELVAFPQSAAPDQELDQRGSVPAGVSSVQASAPFDLEQVVFDQPEAGGPIWTRTSSYKASCDADGWTFYPRLPAAPDYQTLRSTLRSVTVGGQPLPFEPAAPQLQDARVQWRRGAFVEVVEMQKGGAEHGFRFDALPGRGAIEVIIRIDSALECQARAGGLRFSGPYGDVDYSQAVAVDAQDHRLLLDTIWREGAVHITVPESFAAAAALPLRIDPVMSTTLVRSASQQLSRPDITVRSSYPHSEYVTVCESEYTVYDHDVVATRLDYLMHTISTGYIDVTSADWRKPRIAYHASFDNCLTVAEVQSTSSFIVARRITIDTMTAQPTLVVEQAGVIGLPGLKTDPDVGANHHLPSSASYYTIVWCNSNPASGTLGDIYFKQVDAWTGALRSTMPTAIVNDNWNSMRPRISKSATISGAPQGLDRSLITWYETPPSNSGADISAALVTWDGQIVPVGGYPIFYVDSSAAVDSYPAVSRPVMVDPRNSGPQAHLVVWQRTILQQTLQTDLIGAIVDESGQVHTRVDLNAIEGGGSYQGWPQGLAAVDSDGVRFVVAYQGNLDQDVRVSTFAWLPGSNSMVALESRRQIAAGALTDDTTQPCIATAFDAYTVPVEFGIAAVNHSATGLYTLDAFRYRGLAPGGFASLPGFGCGTLGITASGSPSPHGRVNFALSAPFHTGGIAMGMPADYLLPGCSGCRVGVMDISMLMNPTDFDIPPSQALIGMTVAVQGWAPTGGTCYGSLALSGLITLTVQ
jgi:hypothetical protein